MTNDTFKDIEKLEGDLWEAADNLRANSKLTSSDYFMPVLGVIFLRHAANRFEAAHRQIEEERATGRMPRRKVLPADYLRRRALWLPESARYDTIMQRAATSGADLPKLITDAMTQAAELLGDPFFTRSFSMVPAKLGVVELDRLVVFQKFIDVRFMARLKERLGKAPNQNQLFDFCLPRQPAPPPVTLKQTAANSYTLLSPSNDFRFLEAVMLDPSQLTGYQPQGPPVAALALVIGYGSNFLNVASVESRLVLGNGSHRAYALRDLGVTHVPCIVQSVTRREELEVLGYGDLQQNADLYLKSPRPPMLRDYFDQELRRIVSVARKQRAVRVSFGVETMDIPAS